jgi:hypothetical protein
MSRSPRRAALALLGAGLAITAALVCLPVSAASTASVQVPATTVGHSEVHVVGGVLVAMDHIVDAAGTPAIVESTISFRGKLLQLWIYVRFGAGEQIRCLRHGWVTPPGHGGTITQFRCTAVNQPASNAEVWVDARAR